MPEQAGYLVLVDGGGLLVAQEGGLHLFVPETGALTALYDVKAAIPRQRFNDGTCDPRGRLWIGSITMEWPVRQPVGALFRVSPDVVRRAIVTSQYRATSIVVKRGKVTPYWG